MFSVNRFDPRNEDVAEKHIGKTGKRKKKSKSRSLERSSAVKKKKKKKIKIDPENNDDAKCSNRPINANESPITTETSTADSKSKAMDNKQVHKEPETALNVSRVHQASDVSEIGTTEKPAFRVIAPETDGAISSQKNLSTKIAAEAFDDLDLTDNKWLLSSEKKNFSREEMGCVGEDNKSQTSSSIFDPTDEIERALEMTRLDIDEAARRWGMADFLVRNLKLNGHKHFFPIQALVIPDVIVAERHMSSLRVRDVCCAAPTGSGKTLAFVLPVLNALATRRVRRLRALVILPSRDLAQQVYRVFDEYRSGSENDLRIGLAIGQTDFKAEQKKLILGDDDTKVGTSANKNLNLDQLRYSMDKGNLDIALDRMGKEVLKYCDHQVSDRSRQLKKNSNEISAGGISAVDVLVCTPGRLVDHLDNTPGFTLQHLRWLIIDEADRLLSQSYHGWIQRVLDSVNAPPCIPQQNSDNEENNGSINYSIDPVSHRRSERDAFVMESLSPKVADDSKFSTGTRPYTKVCQRIQLRKLLYSATLTKDPQKLSTLRLVNPKFFNAYDLKSRQIERPRNTKNRPVDNSEGSLYRMPEQLREQTVECTAEQKPLVLLALLLEKLDDYREMGKKHTIVIFASSIESTHRLTRLLQLLWQASNYGTPPVEFSSALNQHQRSLLMKRCNDPHDHSISILVCSDGMSRGMDLASCRVVIHYDVPGMAKTYVHRCGRTARAGQDGTAIALLKGKGQAGQFARLRRLIAVPERVTKLKVKTSLVRKVIPLYKHCVSCLREVLEAEDRNQLKTTDPDLSRWLDSGTDGDSSLSDSSI